MMNISSLTKEEMVLIQDALTHYEQRHGDQKDKWQKILAITSVFETAARKNSNGSGDYDNEKFVSMMEQLQIELKRHIKDEESTTRVERERVTLLKAKMILAAQGKAVDQFMSDSLGRPDEPDGD
jgi:hypothetical protein